LSSDLVEPVDLHARARWVYLQVESGGLHRLLLIPVSRARLSVNVSAMRNST
jgi:hypothetical protein